MFPHINVDTCEYEHACMHACGGQSVTSNVILQAPSIFYLREALSLAWGLRKEAKLAGSHRSVSTSHLAGSGILCMNHHSQLFCGFWWFEPMSSHFWGKHSLLHLPYSMFVIPFPLNSISIWHVVYPTVFFLHVKANTLWQACLCPFLGVFYGIYTTVLGRQIAN